MTLADALVVVADMRPEDEACIRAVVGEAPGEWFAAERWRTNGPAWTVVQDGEPWAIGGISMPNRWSGVMWLVCRPGMTSDSWRKCIRKTRTVLDNALSPGNAFYMHRVEALVLDGWIGARLFVERLGFVCEGTRRQAGAAGENIQTWVRLGAEIKR